jgi:hypothetical protein
MTTRSMKLPEQRGRNNPTEYTDGKGPGAKRNPEAAFIAASGLDDRSAN